MKLKLLQWAMDQPPGSEIDVNANVATLLIRRGAAEALDTEQPGGKSEEAKVPPRNKSMAARQKGI